MKLFYAIAALLLSTAAAAKELKVEVNGVQNSRGMILAATGDKDKPAYAMAHATQGSVSFTIEIEDDAATFDLYIIHDEDGDRQLKKNADGKPAEGYAIARIEPAADSVAVTMYYEQTQNF